ncbi:MAG TPA: glycosyltransferase family 2 protein, partial [Rhabdochlamydiaceae bacterium]
MIRPALEKASYEIVHHIKSQLRDNVNDVLKKIPIGNIDIPSLRLLISVFEPSVEKGYAAALPELKKAYEFLQTSDVVKINLPDAFIDASAQMCAIGSTGKRNFAAFTITRNEPFFLELWCRYYSMAFGEENLYVLDNSSDDGSIEKAKKMFPNINVISVPSQQGANWGWCTNVVKTFQRIAFRGYKIVIFADTDEFLIPETGENLRQYSERFLLSDKRYIRARGFGVIQQPDEPALSSVHSILEHRSKAWHAVGYDKTLISKDPLDWAKGNHHIYDCAGVKLVDDPIDKELTLLHLRDVDADVFYAKCIAQAKMNLVNSTFHGATTLEEVKMYFKSRVAPWMSSLDWYEG